jgi:glycosyltransferase involved in cell wall biosynthesis
MHGFPACELRACFDSDRRLFFCQHPQVHTPDGLLQPLICNACTLRLGPLPENRRSSPSIFLNRSRLLPRLASVAVVIPCHNYGRFLKGAISSVLRQTQRPAEIVVVVDDCSDDSSEIARAFADRGVQLIEISANNVHVARRTGLLATGSDVLCFLDADDELPPDYLARGVKRFYEDSNVGVVHSDLQCFGNSDRRIEFPERVTRPMLNSENLIHAGSLVRRDVLRVSCAFDVEQPGNVSCLTGDWWLWKRVLESGWIALRQEEAYRYRRHSESSLVSRSEGVSYYQRAHLDREVVTLFIPLSGRRSLWPDLQDFLDQQTWPRNQIRLMLMDTSEDRLFARQVRRWLAESDYPDFRIVSCRVGEPGLADFPRLEAVHSVRRTMARIYNFLARSVLTPFVWVLEDDILPPLDVCEELLRQFDSSTGSVAAPYRSRYHDDYIVWDQHGRSIRNAGEGVEAVGGNGFGCVLLRSETLTDRVFAASLPNPDFDHEFYCHLRTGNWKAKVHWGIRVEHRSQGVALPEAAHREAGCEA